MGIAPAECQADVVVGRTARRGALPRRDLQQEPTLGGFKVGLPCSIRVAASPRRDPSDSPIEWSDLARFGPASPLLGSTTLCRRWATFRRAAVTSVRL